MTNTPTPTTLEAYFCENCSYLEITTDPIELATKNQVSCPHCGHEALVLLDKEQYSQNFNPDAFDYPQNLLLKTFFENANDRENLFYLFSQEQPLLACSEQIKNLTIVISFKFLVYPTLRSVCKVTDSEGITQTSEAPIFLLIDVLENI
ncbi:hypothetical protein [Cyanothece sp. BG0011]|uniref:hypothetical protein n=1 Tax=Cyanothece sp. BG0011 TaxID=2082950 RepID=UPI000D1D6AB4|nr:hypothetical protein [Cyanothece sp. BG0011]